MAREEIFEKITVIFQDIFDDEMIRVEENTTSADIEDWDSLAHINLIVAIEKEFNIKFSMDEATKMKNVGTMVNSILEKYKDKDN